ncbi:MAG: hypothetical protein AAF485_15380 [Chloroflexota bacterium]
MNILAKHLLILSLMVGLISMACNEEGGSFSEPTSDISAGCADLSGTYDVFEIIEGLDCLQPIDLLTVTADISQNECLVQLSVPGVVTLSGPVAGRTMHLTGEYEDEGTITKDITLTVEDDLLWGTGTWTYDSHQNFACSGSSDFTGFKH